MKPSEAESRLIDVCRRQHKSLQTERSYAAWVRRFAKFIAATKPVGTSAQKAEAFLTHLAKQDVSASTQNQALNALVFFYRDVLQQPLGDVKALRASRPKQIRHAPNLSETRRLLETVPDVGGYPTGLIVRLLYGCGLRLCEPLNLRVKDIDFEGSRIFIMGAKGRKDRVVALPCSVVESLREQIVYARTIWQRDQLARVPVELPHLLAQKYPGHRFAWPWAWVFPSHQPCPHPRTGEMVRWHSHEANVQRAVRAAREPLGIQVTPHELRHAYATHSLERGVNIKALSEAMGHQQIETTAGYCHAVALSVPSPLDRLPASGNETSRPAHDSVERWDNVGPPGSGIETGIGSGIDAIPDSIHEPLRSEILIELEDPCTLRSEIKAAAPKQRHLNSREARNGTQLGTQSTPRGRALMEEAHTQRAVSIAANYRSDGYVMEKLERAPAVRLELMTGRTPTARKWAALYEREPHRARTLLAEAITKPGRPMAWLNTAVKAVRY